MFNRTIRKSTKDINYDINYGFDFLGTVEKKINKCPLLQQLEFEKITFENPAGFENQTKSTFEELTNVETRYECANVLNETNERIELTLNLYFYLKNENGCQIKNSNNFIIDFVRYVNFNGKFKEEPYDVTITSNGGNFIKNENENDIFFINLNVIFEQLLIY